MRPPKTETALPNWIELTGCGEGDVVMDSTRKWIDHHDLPISEELKQRMDRWDAWHDDLENLWFDRNHSKTYAFEYQGPDSPYADVALAAEGAAIARQLMAELPGWTVAGYEYYLRKVTHPVECFLEWQEILARPSPQVAPKPRKK
jgi:hypothetical protein